MTKSLTLFGGRFFCSTGRYFAHNPRVVLVWFALPGDRRGFAFGMNNVRRPFAHLTRGERV